MANKKIISIKSDIVNEIAEKMKTSATYVFFEYQGLTVGETDQLRKKLRIDGSELKIYKNTLSKRALDILNIELGEEMSGPKAIVFGTDSIAPIKVLNDFAKEHKALQIKVGVVDGEVTGIDKLKLLADLPSKETLLTMLAGGLIGVVRDLSVSLDLYSKDLEK